MSTASASRAMETADERVRRETEASILFYARHPDAINQRLDELDREWDMDRLLELMAGSMVGFGLLAGVFARRWKLLPVLTAGFLLQHAAQGWCPPMVLMRQFGVRTAREINQERAALKALRGDFNAVESETGDPLARAEAAINAAAS